MTSITKPLSSYTPSIVREFKLLQIDKKGISNSIYGSSSYRDSLYPSDIDIFEKVDFSGTLEESINFFEKNIQRVVSQIVKRKDHYFSELKCGLDKRYDINIGYTSNDVFHMERGLFNTLQENKQLFTDDEFMLLDVVCHKTDKKQIDFETMKQILRKHLIVRWSAKEVLDGVKELPFGGGQYQLKDAINNISPINMEMLAIVNSKYTDVSTYLVLVYDAPNEEPKVVNLPQDSLTNLDEYINDQLKKTIEKLYYSKLEFNPIKLAKRYLNYAFFNHKNAIVKSVLPLLNSWIGFTYNIASEITALIKVNKFVPVINRSIFNNQLQNIKYRLSNVKNISNETLETLNQDIDNVCNNVLNKEEITELLEHIKKLLLDIINPPSIQWLEDIDLAPPPDNLLPQNRYFEGKTEPKPEPKKKLKLKEKQLQIERVDEPEPEPEPAPKPKTKLKLKEKQLQIERVDEPEPEPKEKGKIKIKIKPEPESKKSIIDFADKIGANRYRCKVCQDYEGQRQGFYKHFTNYHRQQLEHLLASGTGGSIFSEIGRYFRGFLMAIKGVRTNFKPKVRDILQKDGNVPIKELVVCRKPLGNTYNSILNVLNKLSGKEPAHDKLFHLFVIAKLENGKSIKIEKNEDINLDYYTESVIPTDFMPINLQTKMTITEMLENTLKKIGMKDFFEYDAFSTNCQHFIYNLLLANNIQVDEKLKTFILQEVKHLTPEWGQKIAHFLTNLKNKINVIVQGEGAGSNNWKDMEIDDLVQVPVGGVVSWRDFLKSKRIYKGETSQDFMRRISQMYYDEIRNEKIVDKLGSIQGEIINILGKMNNVNQVVQQQPIMRIGNQPPPPPPPPPMMKQPQRQLTEKEKGNMSSREKMMSELMDRISKMKKID
jgi:hypothetical protein